MRPKEPLLHSMCELSSGSPCSRILSVNITSKIVHFEYKRKCQGLYHIDNVWNANYNVAKDKGFYQSVIILLMCELVQAKIFILDEYPCLWPNAQLTPKRMDAKSHASSGVDGSINIITLLSINHLLKLKTISCTLGCQDSR